MKIAFKLVLLIAPLNAGASFLERPLLSTADVRAKKIGTYNKGMNYKGNFWIHQFIEELIISFETFFQPPNQWIGLLVEWQSGDT